MEGGKRTRTRNIRRRGGGTAGSRDSGTSYSDKHISKYM